MSAASLVNSQLTRPEAGRAAVLSDAWVITQRDLRHRLREPWGVIIGWRWQNGLPVAMAAVGVLLLLRFALLWVGIYIGLRARRPQAVMAVQILVWPIGFISSIFVDPASMPRVLGAIASWNQLSITASATRELFGSPGYGGDTWGAQHAVEMAIALPLVITAIFLPLSAQAYRSLSR